MRVFSYRHYESELALVGDWPDGGVEERLLLLHARLWSEAPPQLRPDADDADLIEVARLDHPLARALCLLYCAGGPGLSLGALSAEQLRQVALGALRPPAIAHLDDAELVRLREGAALPALAADYTYVPWLALGALRALASTARWQPALCEQTAAEAGLLALAQGDGGAELRVAAVQALMALTPTAPVGAALRAMAVAAGEAAGEPEWAAAIALFLHDPAAHIELVLGVQRCSQRPAEFSALYTRLELVDEEAELRRSLSREHGAAPLLWHDQDGSLFALCQADRSLPPGGDDPELPVVAAAWVSAVDAARAVLLAQLCHSGHAAGRALAILVGPAAQDCAALAMDDEEPAELADAPPPPDIDWLTLSRQVLADPPLTRLTAADVCTGGAGQRGCNHRAALSALASLAEPGDGDALLMARCLVAAVGAEPNEPVQLAALDALRNHCWRTGQPPPASATEPTLLAAVSTLARDGSAETRRRAVMLLGCWPAATTAELLRELVHDPTYTVCCVAERALADQLRQ